MLNIIILIFFFKKNMQQSCSSIKIRLLLGRHYSCYGRASFVGYGTGTGYLDLNIFLMIDQHLSYWLITA